MDDRLTIRVPAQFATGLTFCRNGRRVWYEATPEPQPGHDPSMTRFAYRNG